jgi:diguanylate cyclase (GGDEF)-like protein
VGLILNSREKAAIPLLFPGVKRLFVSDLDIFSLGILTKDLPEKRFSLPSEIIDHLQILIRGIALHAIDGDPNDLKELQQRMSGIAGTLTVDSSPDDLLVGIGKTLRALEEYNRRAAVIFKGQVEELRGMLSTMTATVIFITSSSESSVKQLSVIESKLQRANTLEDTRQIKAHLTECLTLVRSESLRLQTESRTKINTLKQDVDRLSSRLKSVTVEDSYDPVTGLPNRNAAEEAIAAKIATGKEFLAVLFMLDRLASINGRFGRLVGDDILVSGAQTLAQKLSGTTLYRWTGPAFVAVFDPSVNLAQAETRATQAASMRLEKNIEADNRSVLIVITASCHLQRVSGKIAPDAVFRSMDAFMASHGGVPPTA